MKHYYCPREACQQIIIHIYIPISTEEIMFYPNFVLLFTAYMVVTQSILLCTSATNVILPKGCQKLDQGNSSQFIIWCKTTDANGTLSNLPSNTSHLLLTFLTHSSWHLEDVHLNFEHLYNLEVVLLDANGVGIKRVILRGH